MTVREIKTQYEFTCDVCKTVRVEEHKRRPSTWGTLIVERDAFDFQGNAVADGSVRRLLCTECLDEAAAAVNEWASKRAVHHPLATEKK